MARKLSFLDLLVKAYPELDREKLLALVVCGDAMYGGERVRDPKQLLVPGKVCEINMPEGTSGFGMIPGVPGLPFVSRGGFKLEGALNAWGPPVAGKVWLDAGSSTGGFTHALLLHGAETVHAVDVGYNLLDWRLRTCSRVLLHERTNFQDLSNLEPKPFAAVADLAFRSLQGAARHLLELCSGGMLLALVKPQFELAHLSRGSAGQSPKADFDGIIRSKEHVNLIMRDLAYRLSLEGVVFCRVMASAIKGGYGNQEYMSWLELHAGPGEEILAASLTVLSRAGF